MSRLQLLSIHGGLGPDITGGGQSHLGQRRTNQLVNQNREQNDVADQTTLVAAQLHSSDRHTERNARLWEQGNTQIFYYIIVAFCNS